MTAEKANILHQLQDEILRLQGFKPECSSSIDMKLGLLEEAFPNKSFPLSAIHEFITSSREDLAATIGFVSGLLSSIVERKGTLLWISSGRNLFPPALNGFGIEPDKVIFIDLNSEKHVLWTLEEALKCSALSAVIGEVRELGFTESRRLQLAVEQSKVTGFVLRNIMRKKETTACVSRWKITSLPSECIGDLPGVGFPSWKVELLRVRNGRTGTWNVRWANGRFEIVEGLNSASLPELKVSGTTLDTSTQRRKAG